MHWMFGQGWEWIGQRQAPETMADKTRMVMDENDNGDGRQDEDGDGQGR